MFYWSLRSVPELQRRSAKERRQAVWQMGLKPFLDGQVWLAMLITAIITLWGMETLTGNFLANPEISNSKGWMAATVAAMAAIIFFAQLIYSHAYLNALRPHIRRVSFDPAGSWLGSWIKRLIIRLISVFLIFGCMLAIDWGINSYDEDPDPRLAALKKWPTPVPAEDNGFFTATALLAPPGESPHAAGMRWIVAVNDGALKGATEFPAPPNGLEYAGYAAPPRTAAAPGQPGAAKPAKPNKTARFCDHGIDSCWKVWREEKEQVQSWLSANHELLARYQALQKMPQWQFAIQPAGANTPLPMYQSLLNAQSLHLASALQAMNQGLGGKKAAAKWQVDLFGKGLEMIGADIRFARTVLAGKTPLLDKMVANTLLARDLALLAETMREYPRDIKPHWAQIEAMLEPLTANQVSLADALKFEEKWSAAAVGQYGYGMLEDKTRPLLRMWLAHHYKPNATGRILIAHMDGSIRRVAVTDPLHTPAISGKTIAELPLPSPWIGYMHNQGGKFNLMLGGIDYPAYVNRMGDLNAMNTLLRLRVAMARKNISHKGIPDFLAASDKSLWNPQAGKPFEWDAERKQLYFTPATELMQKRYRFDSAAPGRVALTVQ